MGCREFRLTPSIPQLDPSTGTQRLWLSGCPGRGTQPSRCTRRRSRSLLCSVRATNDSCRLKKCRNFLQGSPQAWQYQLNISVSIFRDATEYSSLWQTLLEFSLNEAPLSSKRLVTPAKFPATNG